MKVLVTGATGFFGAHAVRALLAAGAQVAIVRRESSDLSRLRSLADGAVEHAVGDLESQADVQTIVKSVRPDAILHAAAYGVDFAQQDLQKIVGGNVAATAFLVQAAKEANVRRFVHLGTGFEYGRHDGPICEDAPLRPEGLYGSAKAASSVMALGMASALGLPLCVVRVFGMYGPLEGRQKFIPSVFAAAALGQSLPCSPGEQVRDYTYVADVAGACVGMLLGELPANQAINLGSGKAITIRALAEAACRAASVSPAFLNWGAVPYRANEVMRIVADVTKASRLLGWTARTSLEEGLRETFAREKERGSAEPWRIGA